MDNINNGDAGSGDIVRLWQCAVPVEFVEEMSDGERTGKGKGR